MSGANCWLASYPKSGNTWVRTLVDALVTGEDPRLNHLAASTRSGDPILGLSPSAFTVEELLPISRRATLAQAPESGFRLLKTHAAWLPGEDGYPTRWQPVGARAIYLTRDPRDVAVSWAHHLSTTHEQAVDAMRDGMPFDADRLDPMSELPSWSEHVRSWLDQEDVPTLVLSYERLQEDTVACVLEIADWLSLAATRPEAEAAVERCGFAHLAAQEVMTGFVEAPSHGRAFFRRGVVGAWRTELEPELVTRVESEHAEIMERCGYTR